MAEGISCPTCSEKLDDRDVVKGRVVCWKCGWKDPFPIDDDEWIDALINVWLPYD